MISWSTSQFKQVDGGNRTDDDERFTLESADVRQRDGNANGFGRSLLKQDRPTGPVFVSGSVSRAMNHQASFYKYMKLVLHCANDHALSKMSGNPIVPLRA